MKNAVIRSLLVILVLLCIGAAWVIGPALGASIFNPENPADVETSLITGGALPPGCTCHSSNQSMVSMHKSFGVRDCAKCHGPIGDTFKEAREKTAGSDTDSLKERINAEKICQECHN